MSFLECPVCQRRVSYSVITEVPHRPFCSLRCQQIDLGRWLNEEYCVTEEPPDGVAIENSSPDPAQS